MIHRGTNQNSTPICGLPVAVGDLIKRWIALQLQFISLFLLMMWRVCHFLIKQCSSNFNMMTEFWVIMWRIKKGQVQVEDVLPMLEGLPLFVTVCHDRLDDAVIDSMMGVH